MSRTLLTPCLTLVLLAFSVTSLEAQRDRFVIGVGLGVGSNTLSDDSPNSESLTETGVSTDLRLGGQINPNLIVYYRNTVVFHGADGVDLVASGVSGIGATYIPTDSKLHIMGLVGIAGLSFISDGSTDGDTGLGVAGGVGYEFADRWIVDAGFLIGRPGDDGFTTNVTQFKAGINFLSH